MPKIEATQSIQNTQRESSHSSIEKLRIKRCSDRTRISCEALQSNDLDAVQWFKKLEHTAKEQGAELTSENIRRSIPNPDHEQYKLAVQLADSLEKAENIRKKIAEGENPKPTLTDEGFTFIEHDKEILAKIEEFSEAAYDAVLGNEACKEALENGDYIWIRLTDPMPDGKLIVEVNNNDKNIALEVDFEKRFFTGVVDATNTFQNTVLSDIHNQTGNEVCSDNERMPVTLQIGGNVNAADPHKDNAMWGQFYNFHKDYNNVQAFTTTHALGGQPQTELVLAEFKPFIEGGEYLPGVVAEKEELAFTTYVFSPEDIPDVFKVSSDTLPYTSVFGARTLGDKRPDYNIRGRRESIIHVPPSELLEAEAEAKAEHPRKHRMFLFNRSFMSHHSKEGHPALKQAYQSLFQNTHNLMCQIETLYKAIKENNDINDEERQDSLIRVKAKIKKFLQLNVLGQDIATKRANLKRLFEATSDDIVTDAISSLSRG